MSVCPHCHQMDKNFFAEKCHNCNTYVGFIEQCAHSLIWTVVPWIVIATGVWIVWLIFG